ncbi:MAG: hypothetical protein PHE68_01745 [Candidatus Peribacteraceae bacterium]|nr:hypothetical protein [Candidatus Peribacteraceae bacterium]
MLTFTAGVESLSAQGSSSSVSPDASACRSVVEKEYAREQRLFRSVLLGHPKAKDTPVGDVRYDKKGTAWIKTKKNEWHSVAKGYERTTWTDTQMDGQDEMKDRRGIVETRGVLTSDLVPYFAQAFRALECRTEYICGVAAYSTTVGSKESKKTRIAVPGCLSPELDTYPACQLASANGKKPDEGDVRSYCQSIKNDFLTREENLLKLLTDYDAASRSLLQLSGNFDLFLETWRWSIAHILEQSTSLAGFFKRIPCFIASCDESPVSSGSSSSHRGSSAAP